MSTRPSESPNVPGKESSRANVLSSLSDSIARGNIEKVEARGSPCEDCGETGDCPECGGTGRVAGETCVCADGKCMLCMGTGRTADFFYKGRPVPRYASIWKQFFGYGVAGVALAVALLLVSSFAPEVLWTGTDPIVPVLLEVALGVGGTAALGWSLWLRKLWELEHDAWVAFYPEPEGGW